jgi:WD40 repeat protein
VGGNKAKNKKVWDVRWHPNEMATIASTSDEGLVTLWDLNAPNMKKPVWEGRDDTRSCWRLAWCDPKGNLLLCTGSLDGIVRLWDPRKAASCVNQFILGGHHDSSQFPGQGASGLKVRYLVCSYTQNALQISLV